LTLGKALRYFLREAGVSLVRSWKVSFLAVLVIAVSLFVGGVFLVAAGNLARVVERARDESRIVVYFAPETEGGAVTALAAELTAEPWVESVRVVSAEEARSRFVEIFPSLRDLVEDGSGGALPPSLELLVARDGGRGSEGLEARLAEVRERPGVEMVDDDRDWVRQLSAVVTLVRGLGLTLGGVLLGAAVFTIGSVIRLTAYLYEEEITIMRLVGATEFYIRGPFYAAGLLEGLLGGGVAAATLAFAFWLASDRLGASLLGRMLLAAPPSATELVGLVALGTAAGFTGAILSLRRESLGEPPVDEG
jgi:cell division transport system permease protein